MQFPLAYPLRMSFKAIALAPQFWVRDADGNLLAYVKQKLFKLKEAVTVYADDTLSQPVYVLSADRVIDFSARYYFADTSGAMIGSVKRQGMRSLWKAHYDIMDGEEVTMTIREENGWVKVMDALFTQIPVVSIFSGYMFHPKYRIERPDSTVVMRLKKRSAFLEGKFELEKLEEMTDKEEERAVLSVTMMLLLERMRG